MKDTLSRMFADPAWKSYRLPGSVNRIYYDAERHAAAIVIERSVGVDFALSKVALDYVLAAQAKGDKVESAFIVLRERDNGVFCAAEELKVAARHVEQVQPKEGRDGPFWWINEAFGDPKMKDLVPF